MIKTNGSRKFDKMRIVMIGILAASFLAVLGYGDSFSEPQKKVITDADWVALNRAGYAGTNGSSGISAVLYYRGILYVAGDFTAIGNVRANGIAKWDGSTWSSLGEGLVRSPFYTHASSVFCIKSLAIDSNGTLYAAGSFDRSGGTVINNIARWDGLKWSPLGTGTNGSIESIACDHKGNVYAGGYFTTAGDSTVNHIAKWDGHVWSAMGTGANSSIDAIAVDGIGNLYVMGSFDTISSIPAKYSAKWNGLVWQPFETGFDNYSIPFAVNDGGDVFIPVPEKAWTVRRLKGSEWDTLASCGFYIKGMFCDAYGDIYAIADSAILRLNGKNWDRIPTSFINISGSDEIIRTIAISENRDIFAGGSFDGINKTTTYSIARWDGTRWKQLSDGVHINSTISAVAFSREGKIIIGGYLPAIGGVEVNNIAQWDGSRWTPLGEGFNGDVRAIVCDKDGNVYAGGTFWKSGNTVLKGIAKWDGFTWNPLGLGITDTSIIPPDTAFEFRINALVLDQKGNLYAGGVFNNMSDLKVNNIARWDGTKWYELKGGVNGPVNALLCDTNDNLIIGGNFSNVGKNLAEWNQTRWSSLGSPNYISSQGLSDHGISSLAFDKAGNLYACGNLTHEYVKYPNPPRYTYESYLIKVNGYSWSTMLDDTSEYQQSFNAIQFAQNDQLILSGKFDTINSVAIHNICIVDGDSLRALGSGTDGEINCMSLNFPMLVVGGWFYLAGNNVSTRLAAVNLDTTSGKIVTRFRTALPPVIAYQLHKHTLYISNLLPQDIVTAFSLNGRVLQQSKGISVIPLESMGTHYFCIQIKRNNAVISKKLIFLQ